MNSQKSVLKAKNADVTRDGTNHCRQARPLGPPSICGEVGRPGLSCLGLSCLGSGVMVGRLLVTGPLTGPETGIERAAFRTGGARLRASRSQGSTRRGNEGYQHDQIHRRASSASFSIAPIGP